MTASSSKDLKIYVVLIALLTVSTLLIGYKLGFFNDHSASNYESSPKIEAVANDMQTGVSNNNGLRSDNGANAYVMVKNKSIILSVNCKSIVNKWGEDGANEYIKDIIINGKKSADEHKVKKLNVYVYDSSRKKVIMNGDINDLLKL